MERGLFETRDGQTFLMSVRKVVISLEKIANELEKLNSTLGEGESKCQKQI